MIANDAIVAGAEALGPVFTGWAHLLLRAARRRKLRRLHFVARDGYLLHRVTEQLLKALRHEDEFELDYLYLSRRATQLAARPAINRADVIEAMAVRAGEPTLASILAYHGLGKSSYLQLLTDLGVAADTPLQSLEHCLDLLGRATFRDFIAAESSRQRQAVLAYLDGAGALRDDAEAMVDIGWRGSIQRNLAQVLASAQRGKAPVWLYLGLWREDGKCEALPAAAEGVLSDLRRGRHLSESAPWQLAFLLEAVCRKNEGTVLNYRMTDAHATPVLASADDPARLAERYCTPAAEAVRAGILDYVASSGPDPRWTRLDDETLRREVQRRLLRIAFMPNPSEVALGENLVHTESHDPHWSSPLVLPHAAGPLSSPRQWLAGMASPWRGAYVMASGGRPLALVYRGIESLLLRMPPSARALTRNAALVLSGRHPRTT